MMRRAAEKQGVQCSWAESAGGQGGAGGWPGRGSLGFGEGLGAGGDGEMGGVDG